MAKLNKDTTFLSKDGLIEKNLNDEFDKVSSQLKQTAGMDYVDNKDFNEVFYPEIEVSRHVHETTNTTYYITKIPKYDNDGNLIKLKRGFSHDVYESNEESDLETPRRFGQRHGATVVTNASTFSTNTYKIVGTGIYNGEIQQEQLGTREYNYILAIGDDNHLRAYPPETSAQTILNDGYKNALTSFIPLVEGGVIVDDSVFNTRDIFLERHPRQAIRQDREGNIYFFTSEGRIAGEYGLTGKETAEIMVQHDMRFGFMLDGGGSTQTVYANNLINRVSDDYGQTERDMLDFLYVSKEKPFKNINETMTKIGEVQKLKSEEMADFMYNNSYWPSNHIPLEEYLINGWRSYAQSGANKCRAWKLSNQTIYFVGTITGGEIGVPFMQLPPSMRPMFSTHHLVPGNKEHEVYKIIIATSGELTVYYWSEEGKKNSEVDPDGVNPDYVKLDGLFIPINPDTSV